MTFEVQDHPANPAWAESITMLLEMADGTVSRHSCDFWMEGPVEYEAEAKVVPENITKEEISTFSPGAIGSTRNTTTGTG